MPEQPITAIAGTTDTPLVINGIKIPCYVLEDGTRVLSQRGFLGALGRSETPPARHENGVDNPPFFLAAKNLKAHFHWTFPVSTTPIQFQTPGGGPSAYGYRAELLPEVCRAYLRARRAGELLPAQQHIAERAEILLEGIASVGIVALIDEATGYQNVRADRALATILEQFIATRMRPWERTFPPEFYEHMYRLHGWGAVKGPKHPQAAGGITNNIVYQRLAPGVLDELQRINPTLDQGWRKSRHHQWLTEGTGYRALREHLAVVVALMTAASTWAGFMRSLNRARPALNKTIPLALEDNTD